jgi:hypothetical protein
MKIIIEKIVANFNSLKLSEKHEDGRINSALSEEIVIEEFIKNAYNLGYVSERSAKRDWYDVSINIDNKVIPINVKITDGGTDNISSKKGMYYALTGLNPDNLTDQWIPFNKSLLDNINFNSDADYYFIVVFKHINKILVTSLLEINTLVPNGNNLPFQCNWGSLSITKRSRKEQIKYVLEKYYESWKKKCKPFLYLQDQIEGLL